MEMVLYLGGCLGWHLLVLLAGAWLWAVKPWRVARDYGEFRQWQQSRQAGPGYQSGDGVFTEVR